MRASYAILCLIVCLAAGADARTWHVPGDAPTIQAGLDLAAAGDTVLVAAGVYLEHDLVISEGLLLRGETGLADGVVIDAQLQGRLLAAVAVADTVRVEGITFRNGLAAGGGDPARGGAVFLAQTSARFRDCDFLDNTAESAGGALHAVECALVELIDCDLSNNTAFAAGYPAQGGAVAVFAYPSDGSLVLRRCSLDGNLSGGPGGAIYLDDGNLFLTDTEVTGSRSGQVTWPAGAGVFVRRANASPGGGGAPDLVVRITGCRFADNAGRIVEAPYGGDGGGVLIKGFDAENLFDVLVTDSVFERNFNAQGAGLYVGRYAQGTVSRCRFRFNRAYLAGGGAVKGGRWPDCMGETARFEYCEFVANEAGYDENGQVSPELGFGGAFYARYYPRAEFFNCTFVQNRAGGILPRGDAIYHNSEGFVFDDPLQLCSIVNSVFYGSRGINVQVRAEPDGFDVVSHCAWEAGEFSCPGVTPTSIVELTESPFLAQLDLRLHDSSPCIAAGMKVWISPDLVGTVVPIGATDIGAYEWIPPDGVSGATTPGAIPALTAAPNPFNPRTTIAFSLARAGRAHLACYDLSGRRVRTLLDTDLPAGPYRVAWDGRDDGGRPLASAVYLLRLTTPARVETGRVLLIK